jgi:hypothetical protein
VATTAIAAFAQAADATAKADAKAKAEEVLKKARAAIGDEKKFKELTAVTATGTARQSFGQMQMENEVQLDLMMPDKIQTTFNMLMGGNAIGTRISTLNGDSLWNDFIPGMGGGGGGARMMGGGGPGGPGGGDPNSPMAKYGQMNQRRDLALLMLSMFLTVPATMQMEYTYAGEAPGPEGAKLDAVIGKSALGFNTVLYFNQESHQLVGLKYKGKEMRAMFGNRGPGGGQRQGGQPGQPGAQPGQPGGQRPELTPEEREQRRKEAAERFDKAPEVDYSWAFSDYKSVGGFNLPHRITKSQGGTPNEEWEISKFKINPKLTADKFVKKEKEKAATN